MKLEEMTREELIKELTQARNNSNASNASFDELVDSAPDAFALFDSGFYLLALNRAGLKMLGDITEKKDAIGKHISDIYEPAKDSERLAAYIKVLETGRPYTLEETLLDIGPKNMSISVKAFKVGPNLGLIVSDITRRKHFEEKLRESELKFRAFIDNSSYGYFEIDLNGNITFANKSVLKFMHYSLEEIQKMNFKEIVIKEDAQRAANNLEKVISQTNIGPRNYQLNAKDGSIVHVEVNTIPIIRKERPIGFQGTVIDLTNRKKAEQALAESEKKYRLLVEKTTDIPYNMDQHGIINYVGPQVKRYGIEPENVLGSGFWEYILQKDRDKLIDDIKLSLASGEEFPSEFRLKDINGQIHWIEERGRVNRSETGEITGISGILRDITERKKAEEALRESEAKWRSLVENAPNIIMIINSEGTIEFINRTLPGLDSSDIVGANQYDYIEPAYHEMVKKITNRVFETGEPGKYQIQGTGPDETISWYETNVSPIMSEGRVAAVTLIISDITERKYAEEALAKNEKAYRLLAENVSDVIWTMDMNFNLTYISPSVLRQRGYTVEEALKYGISEMLTSSSVKHAQDIFTEEMAVEKSDKSKERWSRTISFDIVCKDGSIICGETQASFIRDKDGKPMGILGVTRDITERKAAEQALRESEEKFRNLSDEIADGVAVVIDGKNYWLNSAFCQIFGYTKEELIGKDSDSLIAPEEMPRLRNYLGNRMKGFYAPSYYETMAICSDGRRINISVAVKEILFENKRAMQIVVRDITEQKAFAKRLAEAHEEERRILSEKLHDDLGQFLTVAKIRIDKLRDARLSDMALLTRDLSEISSLLTDILQKTRDLSHSLRPPLLNQLGLVPTLRALANQFQSNTGMNISIETNELHSAIPAEIEMLTFRVIQESLTNAARYADAPEVSVSVSIINGSVDIEVKDNGIGFDVEKAKRRTDCIGIRSIESRVTDSGGVFLLESETSKGTRLKASIPLNQ